MYKKHQVVIWTNNCLCNWRIYASLGLDHLTYYWTRIIWWLPKKRRNLTQNGYNYIYMWMQFTGVYWWVENFEIRVGENADIGSNEICHKQLDATDSIKANITCSREFYGDFVSINKTALAGGRVEYLILAEVQVFGSYQGKFIFGSPIFKWIATTQ